MTQINSLPAIHEVHSTYEVYKDKNFHFHNPNGPALIEQDGVSFYTHGEDWTDEEYQNFINQKMKETYPEIDLNDYPFSQIESIVMSITGWVKRKPIANNITRLIREAFREENIRKREQETRQNEQNNSKY